VQRGGHLPECERLMTNEVTYVARYDTGQEALQTCEAHRQAKLTMHIGARLQRTVEPIARNVPPLPIAVQWSRRVLWGTFVGPFEQIVFFR
jgi:hypothetical protein